MNVALELITVTEMRIVLTQEQLLFADVKPGLLAMELHAQVRIVGYTCMYNLCNI